MPDRSLGSLFHRSQTKTRTVRSCWQTHRGRPSKPDPSDLLRSPRRCPTIFWLETRSWSTSHYLDPSDLPGHRNISDRRSAAGRRPLVLVTNHNCGMLQLNASRIDDEDAVILYWWCVIKSRGAFVASRSRSVTTWSRWIHTHTLCSSQRPSTSTWHGIILFTTWISYACLSRN